LSYSHAKVINVYEGSDRQTRVDILARDDGFFEYRAYTQRFEEFTEEYYWSPTVKSGIYANVEDAERDALREVLALDTKSKQGH